MTARNLPLDERRQIPCGYGHSREDAFEFIDRAGRIHLQCRECNRKRVNARRGPTGRDRALRAGALAERERIVTLLREPSETDIDQFAYLLVEHGAPTEDDVRAVLNAIADHLTKETGR